jgi:hypothetical protein
MNHKAKTGIFLYLPIAGIFLFFVLYIFAASKYPGGSQADDFSIGFDWFHNYWCDLMKEVAYNESKNPARPIAIAATFLLSFSISLFSIQFPKYLPVSNFWNRATSISGTLAMITVTLIFTDLHDKVIIVCSLFGLITVVGIFKGLILNKEILHQRIAFFCFFLILINNVLYHGEQYYYLPLIQKLTFLIILIWFVTINWLFIKKASKTSDEFDA